MSHNKSLKLCIMRIGSHTSSPSSSPLLSYGAKEGRSDSCKNSVIRQVAVSLPETKDGLSTPRRRSRKWGKSSFMTERGQERLKGIKNKNKNKNTTLGMPSWILFSDQCLQTTLTSKFLNYVQKTNKIRTFAPLPPQQAMAPL